MRGALPFTKEQFFELFAAYNVAIWPAQIVAISLAMLALAAVWFWPAAARTIVFGALALMWAWTGLGYHISYFAQINGAAVGFGVLFVAQAALFALAAVRMESIEFTRSGQGRRLGLLLVAYATLIYPLIGMWTGHVYPAAPTFGVTPCPLVIFTFGILLFLRRGAPWGLLAIPLAWAVIGGSAAFLLDVPQDWALPAAAIVASWLNASLRRIA